MSNALGDGSAIEAWSASQNVGLRVEFVRLADRFQHVVSMLGGSPLPSTDPHPNPLPEGEGTVASSLSPWERAGVRAGGAPQPAAIANASSGLQLSLAADSPLPAPSPHPSPLPEGEGTAALPSSANTLALRSAEGTGNDAWPSSPPLQSLHIETLPDGRKAALLVGMAGRGHWSASIEAVPGAAAVVFDIACRSSAPPDWLGSTYTRETASTRLQIIPEQAGASLPPRISGGETMVIECPLSGMRGPTWRWRYRLELLPSPDEIAS